MAFYPATLEPADELFKTCGHSGCREIAVFVLKAGGQEQVFCCLEHGRILAERATAKALRDFALSCASAEAAAIELFEEWPGAVTSVAGALVEMVTPTIKQSKGKAR